MEDTKMKKIINKPENVVAEMCNGIALAHGDLEFISKYKVVKKSHINTEKVTLISGGGSGHEPAHVGFIGEGMLDVAICGDVFASPSQIQIYQGIKASVSNKGTLLIIKNYSGDVMNFKNAAYLASEDGICVDYVCVDDDIAVQDSLYTVGRRGVAGTVFVHKVAGAAAEQGRSLAAVKEVALKAIDNVRSIGFALTSCVVPAKGSPTFELGENEMEYGVGIHGEPGIQREAVESADELADKMVEALLKDLKIAAGSNQEVAILVNGFGGSPLQELYLFNNSVVKALAKRGVKVHRIFVGNYMTSIDMCGASLSIMKLDEEMKELLSKVSTAPGFMVLGEVQETTYKPAFVETSDAAVSFVTETAKEYATLTANEITIDNIIYIVDKMSEIIITNEVPFCELDAHAGDGDFGMSIAKGFRQLKREWQDIMANDSKDIGRFLGACAMVIMEYCGGASGPIWGSAFRAAGKVTEGKAKLSTQEFAQMMQAAVKGIQSVGERSFGRGAVVGDKTLIDALMPCADTWANESDEGTLAKEIFTKAAQAAVEGARKTEEIVARMGRAGTVGERSIGYPDAGAYGLGVIFTEIAKALK